MSGKKDPSTSEDSEKIDYVLVHEVDNDKDKTEMRDNFLQFIENEGLEIPKLKKNSQENDKKVSVDNEKGGCWRWIKRKILTKPRKTVLTEVHVPCKTLLMYAELLKMKMPYKENDLPTPPTCSCNEDRRKTYLELFESENDQLMDKNVGNTTLKDQSSEKRCRICFEILSFNYRSCEGSTTLMDEAKTEDNANKCSDGITTLIDKKTYIAAFPLHDRQYFAEGNDRQLSTAYD